MKSVLRAGGIPCARHRLADSAAAAADFAREVGFPLVVKPPAGAGAKSTFRLDDPDDLRCGSTRPRRRRTGSRCSRSSSAARKGRYDSVMLDGRIVSGLAVGLPAHAAGGAVQPVDPVDHAAAPYVSGPEYEGVRATAPTALRVSGRSPSHPPGVVPASRRHASPSPRSRCGRPAPGSPPCCATPRLRPVRRMGAAHGAWQLRARRNAARRCDMSLPARNGHVLSMPASTGCQQSVLVVESRLPSPGQLPSDRYEVAVRCRTAPRYLIVTDAMTIATACASSWLTA